MARAQACGSGFLNRTQGCCTSVLKEQALGIGFLVRVRISEAAWESTHTPCDMSGEGTSRGVSVPNKQVGLPPGCPASMPSPLASQGFCFSCLSNKEVICRSPGVYLRIRSYLEYLSLYPTCSNSLA